MNLPPLLRIPLVTGVSLLVLSMAACGGDSKDAKEAPKKPAGESSTTSGYDLTAAQIVEQSRATLKGAKSVHVKGPLAVEGKGAKIDVVIAGGSAKGMIDFADKGVSAPVDLVKVGGKLYLKGKKFWAGNDPAAKALIGDRWVIATAGLAKSFDAYLTTEGLCDLLPSPKSLLSKGPPSKINDTPVTLVQDHAGGRNEGDPYYVTADGTLHPVRMFDGAKALNFTYEAPGEFKAPEGAIDARG